MKKYVWLAVLSLFTVVLFASCSTASSIDELLNNLTLEPGTTVVGEIEYSEKYERAPGGVLSFEATSPDGEAKHVKGYIASSSGSETFEMTISSEIHFPFCSAIVKNFGKNWFKTHWTAPFWFLTARANSTGWSACNSNKPLYKKWDFK